MRNTSFKKCRCRRVRNISLRRRALLAAGIATAVSFLPTLARANPADGNVVAGQATVTTGADTVNINQSSDRVVIDWRSFDIAPNETTNFTQPTSSSIALNRVTNGQASRIEGALTANGNIILVNPNGVLIRAGARIDVAGLVATTADIDNDKFMSGSTTFDKAGNPDASIVNAGAITAKDAGLVGLVAPNVENSGVITARLGRVQLASGETFTADFYGDGLLEVSVGRGLNSQLVKNTGTISAAGGTIALTAAAGSQIVNSLITVAGELDAPTVAEKSGKIVIYAEGTNAVPGNIASEKGTRSGSSTVTVAGLAEARGDDAVESGGNISVLADHVKVLSTASLDASGKAGGGKILVGGAAHGEGATPTAISTTVQKGAAIRANAETSGNAGSVVVWSDETTNFAGAIEARALGFSGNGGFVETSGHTLEATGSVLADAVHGTAGTWLLDPTDITIGTTTSDGTFDGGAGTFTPSAPSSNVSAATINSALNAGTSVTISTASSYSGNGDITVSSALSKTAGGDATLTLQANRNILVNAAIGSTVGALNVVLDSNSTGAGAGYVDVAGTITTNGIVGE